MAKLSAASESASHQCMYIIYGRKVNELQIMTDCQLWMKNSMKYWLKYSLHYMEANQGEHE